ncbi:DNA polymerase III subunit alpha [Bacillus timonensis]|nr:DNA polymerase III subunit alpha [Bacillus timonensis]
MSFIHLQVKSAFSLLKSSAQIEKLVKKAHEIGYSALAITDENVMYGALSFYKECKKLGIKPIVGLTATIISDANAEHEEAYPLILLAKNQKGYVNLLKLSSILQTTSKVGVPKKWLPHYSEGLIAITPGISGEIETLIEKGKEDEARAHIDFYQKIFSRGDFFFSIQNHDLVEEKKLYNRMSFLAKEKDVPFVATNNVQYIEKSDAFAHECLLSIKDGTKLSDEERRVLPNEEYYLKSPKQMVDLFYDMPEVLENTIRISNKCCLELELGVMSLPKYPVPNNESADEYLARICMIGLKKRGKHEEDAYLSRLTYELDVIQKMKFSDYFLIVWDFMKYAHDHDILTGPGRGSAAGSLVSYVLSITDVDPIEHALLFERFLNPERISMPDIDIDFPDNRRDELIDYVAKKYGRVHVAQIITFGTLAARAALRDVGRVMGIPTKEADFLAKQIPHKLGITLQEAYDESHTLRNYINDSDIGKKIFQTALKIEGLPRHTSTHAAGVVISENPLTNVVALQEGHNEVYLTQYSMEYLEEVGLLKMDFLGLRNLTLLENIRTNIFRATREKIDLASLPLNDRKTFDLLSNGDTTGIFQLESSGMRHVLTKLKPTEFEDIVAVNALYRPGPMDNIPLYIERKHKKKEISYPHQDLEEILKPTYGVIVYQEQIMEIASKMAGFSLGQADLLRRAVSKKKKEDLDEQREHFVKGSLKKGYSKEDANTIYDLIVRFANYGFNRSHAVAYSLIAYQLAYLKANYPLYFFAALLTSALGNEDKISQYTREAKQRNIKILPPSINKSWYPFLVEDGCIRFSLSAIKGVGSTILREIFEERKKKRFEDLFDFCIRTSSKGLNRKMIESLINSGAFDEFKMGRATYLASLDVALEHAELVRPTDEDQFDLFDEEEFMFKPKYVEVEEFPQEEKLAFEKEALGFYLSSHPISAYQSLLKNEGVIYISDLSENLVKKLVKLGGYITNHRTIRTKKGEVMAFLTISDESGDLDAVAFPATYTKYGKLLEKGELALLKGTVDKRENRLQFIIKEAESLKEIKEHFQEIQKLFVKFNSSVQSIEDFQHLKNILLGFPGNHPVLVFYVVEQKTIQLQKEYWVNPTEECIKKIRDLLGKENIVLK